jgi:hypothetical protein
LTPPCALTYPSITPLAARTIAEIAGQYDLKSSSIRLARDIVYALIPQMCRPDSVSGFLFSF